MSGLTGPVLNCDFRSCDTIEFDDVYTPAHHLEGLDERDITRNFREFMANMNLLDEEDKIQDICHTKPYAVRLQSGLTEMQAYPQIKQMLSSNLVVEIDAEYFGVIAAHEKEFAKDLQFMIIHHGQVVLMVLKARMTKFPSGKIREKESQDLEEYQRDITRRFGIFTGFFFGGRSYAFANFGSSLLALRTSFTPLELLQNSRAWIMDLVHDITCSGQFLSRYNQRTLVEGQFFAGPSQYQVWEYNELVYVTPSLKQDPRLPNLLFRMQPDDDFFTEMVKNQGLPSIGSIGHVHGNCRPCQFECFGRHHCKNEDQCTLCHCDHTSKKKEKAVEWRKSHQQAREMYRSQCSQSRKAQYINLGDLSNVSGDTLKWFGDFNSPVPSHPCCDKRDNTFLRCIATSPCTETTRSRSSPSGEFPQ